MSELDRNPYAPPLAPVADVTATLPAIRPPRQVVWVVGLMWTIPILGFLSAPWTSASHAPTHVSPGFVLAIELVTFAILAATFAGFSIGLWRGRHWVRITYIVVNVMGILVALPRMGVALKAAPLSAVVQGVQDLMTVASVVLLLTPSAAAWFKRGSPVVR